MVTDSLSAVPIENSDSFIPILLVISPYLILFLTLYLTWRSVERKRYYKIEAVQSYIMFLIRDNLNKISKQEGLLREFIGLNDPREKNLTLVASINIQDIYRIPQPDVFAALVQIKDKPSSAKNQYQILSRAMMLAIKSLEHVQRDYDYYRDIRLGYEKNYYNSVSDLNYFLDGLKHMDSSDSDYEPFIEEIKLIWNKFTEDRNMQINVIEKYHSNLVVPLNKLLKPRYDYPHYQKIMRIVRECMHWYVNYTKIISVIKEQLSSHADNLKKAEKELAESIEVLSEIKNKVPKFFNLARI